MVASLVRNEGPEGREAGFLARNWGRVGTWYRLCVLLGSVRELDLDHTEMDVGEADRFSASLRLRELVGGNMNE